MKYLLDTNTCIFLMKNRSGVVEKYMQNKVHGIGISMITVAELQYGVYNSSNVTKNASNLAAFLIGLDLLEFDSAAAMQYGIIRSALQKKGTPIGNMDMLIAAQAKAGRFTLVTNNTGEFSRVDELDIEDWLD